MMLQNLEKEQVVSWNLYCSYTRPNWEQTQDYEFLEFSFQSSHVASKSICCRADTTWRMYLQIRAPFTWKIWIIVLSGGGMYTCIVLMPLFSLHSFVGRVSRLILSGIMVVRFLPCDGSCFVVSAWLGRAGWWHFKVYVSPPSLRARMGRILVSWAFRCYDRRIPSDCSEAFMCFYFAPS